jgi:hypothetical protein
MSENEAKKRRTGATRRASRSVDVRAAGNDGNGDTWLIQVADPTSAGEATVDQIVEAIRNDSRVQVKEVRSLRGGPHWLTVQMPASHKQALETKFPGRLIIERNVALRPLGPE